MANVIKIKRGTSTPTTSDIADGEVAIDKSAQKLYLNDGGSVKEIGGGSSGTATQITVADESTDTTCFPVFVTDGGTVPPKVDFGSLQYNSSTGNLAATSFTGSASGLTGIQLTTADETSDTTCFPVFVTDGGAQDPKVDFSNLQYNSSTGNLTATKFTGDGSGLTNLPGGSGTATQVTVADESSDTTCFPVFTTAATGDQAPKTGTNLNFNSSNGTLTATTFSGSGSSLTGLTGASAATYGDGSNVAQIAVDANGRITGISNVSISGGGGGGSAISSAVYTGPSSATTLNSTSYSTLDIDTAVGSTTGFSNTNGLITLGAAGTYLAMCTIVVNGDGSGTNRWTGELEVRQNSTTLGSVQGGYVRNSSGSEETYVSISRVITTPDSDDTIDFRIKKIGGSSSESVTLVTNLSTIQVIKLDGAVGPAGPSDIPQNSQTSAYTLVAGDSGKHINITTGGVTVPSGVFSAGNVVSIYNDSGSNQTITQGGSVTLRLAGSATTGDRVLAQYGLCSALCIANNEFVISGAGLT